MITVAFALMLLGLLIRRFLGSRYNRRVNYFRRLGFSIGESERIAKLARRANWQVLKG